jgi:hypothetical protein
VNINHEKGPKISASSMSSHSAIVLSAILNTPEPGEYFQFVHEKIQMELLE